MTNANGSNDIALLELCEPMKFNSYVQPIMMPPIDIWKNDLLFSDQLTTAGWGYWGNDLLDGINIPDDITHEDIAEGKISLPSRPLTKMRIQYYSGDESSVGTPEIRKQMFLGLARNGKTEVAMGDSGSPVWWFNFKNLKYYQV